VHKNSSLAERSLGVRGVDSFNFARPDSTPFPQKHVTHAQAAGDKFSDLETDS